MDPKETMEIKKLLKWMLGKQQLQIAQHQQSQILRQIMAQQQEQADAAVVQVA